MTRGDTDRSKFQQGPAVAWGAWMGPCPEDTGEDIVNKGFDPPTPYSSCPVT